MLRLRAKKERSRGQSLAMTMAGEYDTTMYLMENAFIFQLSTFNFLP